MVPTATLASAATPELATASLVIALGYDPPCRIIQAAAKRAQKMAATNVALPDCKCMSMLDVSVVKVTVLRL